MGYYGYCNTDNSTSHPGTKIVPVGLQNIVESILEGLEGQLAPNLGRHWPMVSSLLFTFFLFIFVGNELA